jgi:phage head maturation protease
MPEIFYPPKAVQNACKRGLYMFEQGMGGDGLEPATIKEARSMAAGEQQTENKIRKGYRWWARNARFLDEPEDSPAYVAALLWGGRTAKAWFTDAYNYIIDQEQNRQMNMTKIQHRQFDLRMDDAVESKGGLKGTALAYGKMDSYMTVFAPGSATAALPDFVANGSFLAAHDADDLAIGYIRSAADNGAGIEVEVDYHTTGDAQDARTVAMERLAAGKRVGLSIGFNIGDYVELQNGDALLEMAATMNMDLNAFDVESIRKCQRECYLITRIAKIFEVSQVNFPAVPESEATAVRQDLGSAPAGRSMADEIDFARDAVDAATKRATEVFELRSSENKTLGKTSIEKLQGLRDALDQLISAASAPSAMERQAEKFAKLRLIK